MDKIVVTGGAGLIGSNIIKELNHAGIENIIVVDHISNSEKWKNLISLEFIDYIEKDDFIQKLDHGILEGVTHIIHMGACSSTTETNGSYLIQNNFEYTKSLALYSVKKGIQFLYASSAATYGNGENGYSEEAHLNLLKPLNMYGYSKHIFDVYATKNGLIKKITGLKYFNVFGFGEFHKGDMRSVVLKGYEQIKSFDKLKLFKSYNPYYKDGEQKRDFLYVKDAALITLHLISGQHFGLYNVGSGKANTWNDMAKALFQAMNRKYNVEYIEMPESLKPKYQYYTCANVEKLYSTGYKGSITSLENAIKEYVGLLESNL